MRQETDRLVHVVYNEHESETLKLRLWPCSHCKMNAESTTTGLRKYSPVTEVLNVSLPDFKLSGCIISLTSLQSAGSPKQFYKVYPIWQAKLL